MASWVNEVLADSPVAWLRMSEASGLPQDSSGNGHHVSAVGGTLTYLQEDGVLDDPDAYGAILFNGTDNQLTIPASAALNTDSLSVEILVNPTVLRVQGLVVKNSVSSWRLFMNDASGHIEFDALADAANCATTGGNVVAVGAWAHVVATYDVTAQEMNVYINGGAAKATTSLIAGIGGTFNSAIVVAGTTVNRMSGKLDETILYNAALSQARVQAHYDALTRAVYGVATLPRRARRVRS